MAINLVVGGVKECCCIFSGSVNMDRFDDPDAYAFIAAAIHIAGVFECHLSIRCMETANMFVAKSLFRANKYFPERPVFHEEMK